MSSGSQCADIYCWLTSAIPFMVAVSDFMDFFHLPVIRIENAADTERSRGLHSHYFREEAFAIDG